MNKFISFILCAILFLTVFSNIGVMTSGGTEDLEDPLLINLKVARFDPLMEEPDIPSNLIFSKENGYYLVQCQGPILSDWVLELERSGAVILGYIPDYTFIIKMDLDVRTEVEQLPFVRWVGIYHPAYKIDSGLGTSQGNVQLNVMVFPTSMGSFNLQPVKDMIMGLGGTIQDVQDRIIRCEIDSLKIVDIAFILEVEWVEEYLPPVTFMDNIRVFTGAESPLHENGFTGTGIVGEIQDTGIDQDHPEFEGQLIGLDGNVDEDSHGTSTFGIVFARGATPQALGMIPEAEGVFCDWGVGRKQSIANLVNNWGGLFQSNSWGTASTDGVYGTMTQQNDESIFEYGITALWASGNGGSEGSITRDAAAKNVITVGALDHYNNQDRTDDQHTGSQGNRGPTADGRIKPDVVGPYDQIYTTTSGDGYTSGFGGTSGATPVVAGGVGLIYEMYIKNHFGNNPQGSTPNPSTVKAILIADAYQYEFSQGDRFAQGWGLVDVGNVFNIGEEHFIDDESYALETGEMISYKVTPTTTTPLKISLVWTDVPGTTSSSMHLVNDLSLRVTDPQGTVYLGNFGLETGKWSSPDGSADHTNNVENVFIETPASGEWTIEVLGENIPRDGVLEAPGVNQNFALVASGVTRNEHDVRVEALDLPKYTDVGESVSIVAKIMNIGQNTEGSVRVNLLVDESAVASKVIGSIGVSEIKEAEFLWTPSEAKWYNISVQVEPLGGESSMGDNSKSTTIDASVIVGRILVDEGHGTDWRHHIYYHIIETMGPENYRVFYTQETITSDVLYGYDVFVSAWPSQAYSTEEEAVIQDFVNSGGGLLVIGEAEADIYQDLTDYAGIDWGLSFMLLFTGETTEFNQHEITQDIDSLYFGSHQLPLEVSSPAQEIVYTYDGVAYTRVVVAVSEYGSGKVVAIADEECLGSESFYEHDNWVFGENIVRWLTNEKPIAIIDGPVDNGVFNVSDSIIFNASSSYDPDGDDLTYLWSSDISGEIGNKVSFSTTLQKGEHTITLEVADAHGKSASVNITIRALILPDVAIAYPQNGALVNGDVEITGTASDEDGSISEVFVRIDEDGEWEIATDTSPSHDFSNWKFSLNSRDLSDGDHSIFVYSVDSDGLNSSLGEVTVTIDNTPPEITNGPTADSVTYSEARITWETNEESDSVFEYWTDDPFDVEEISETSFSKFHSVELADLLSETTYHFRIEANDEAGNLRTIGNAEDGTFTTDAPPDLTPPTVSIKSPEDGEWVKGSVPISVDAWDDRGLSGVDFYIDDVLKFTDDDSGYSWVWDTTQGHYPDSEYSIKVTARDFGGNSGSHEILVILDNEVIAPSLVEAIANPGSVESGTSQDVLFTVEIYDPEERVESVVIDLSSISASSQQVMYDDGSHGDKIPDDDVYSFSEKLPSDLSSGIKVMPVRITYNSNEQVDSTITLSVTAPPDDGTGDGGPDDGGPDDPGGNEGSGDSEDEEELPWLLIAGLAIGAVLVLIGLLSILKARRARTASQAQVVAPVYQTGYEQYQQAYYQGQGVYNQEMVFRQQ